MNKRVRLSTLLELLTTHGQLTVDGIVAELGVSPATARRDLDELAQQRLLTRTRGGAVAIGGAYDLPLRYRASRQADEKERIADAASAMLTAGAVVGLNGGTTTTAIAHRIGIAEHLTPTSNRPGVTVVTNAVNIAHDLTVRPHVRIVMTGGVARTQSYELIGPMAAVVAQEINLDVMFLGVDAISPADGATAHNEGEAAINRLLASRAKRVVVVTDSTKIGGAALVRICSTPEIHTLVTDTGADPEVLEEFQAAGVRVLAV